MTSFFRIHSGGVTRNGQGTLLVGPKGAGKSTLVTRLVADGFSLLSDDEVWIHPRTLMAYPSPRHILLKGNALELFPNYTGEFIAEGDDQEDLWWLDPEDIRRNCRAIPAPIWGILFIVPFTSCPPVLNQIDQTQALNSLLRECMNFPEFKEKGLSILVELVRSSKVFAFRNGDLEKCSLLLKESLP